MPIEPARNIVGLSVMSMAVEQQAGPVGRGLTLRGIGVRFGGLVALDDVSLDVPDRGVVGIIGPNGAGKTTLFNLISGDVRCDRGRIEYDGRDVTRLAPHRRCRGGIGRSYQVPQPFGHMTVFENLLTAACFGGGQRERGRESGERALRQAALDCLDELGVAGYADRSPGSLPYPLRKRVALARALVSRPRLLLLDEPAGGLGAEDVDELADLIRALPDRDGGGCAVALVEHHMDLVMRVCERVVVLDFGRVIAAGAPDEVRNDPVVADAYLGTDADPEAFGSNRAGAAAPDRGDAPGRGVEERRRPEAPGERANREAQ